MGEVLIGGSALISLLVVILVVCWIFVPFALFGIKPLLRELRDEQQRTNALLSELAKRQG